jgi:hypothetical protein
MKNVMQALEDVDAMRNGEMRSFEGEMKGS